MQATVTYERRDATRCDCEEDFVAAGTVRCVIGIIKKANGDKTWEE